MAGQAVRLLSSEEAQVIGLRSQLEDAIAHRAWLAARLSYTDGEVLRLTNALKDAECQLLEVQR